MIYEFKSRATGSVIMTNDIAQAVLTIIGKSPAAQGIIVPDAMPAAIAALQQAVAAQQTSEQTTQQPSTPADKEPAVSLGQRAFPIIEMMQRAHAAGKEITWGV
jgi:Domain of unknown function (DUF1840)